MLVHDYELDERHRHLVARHTNVEALFNADGRRERPALLVWEQALASPPLLAHFGDERWPLKLLSDLPPGGEWKWECRDDSGVTTSVPEEMLDAVRRATGVDGQPSGNVLDTLVIREYTERESIVGGRQWWQERRAALKQRDDIGAHLMDALIDIMQKMESAGSDLYVEQLVISLSKDDSRPIASLTPTLHSDMYYGVRETAISSILERGWESLGGALSIPTITMQDVWHHRPIDLAKISDLLADEPMLVSRGGDVLIYDGMIDANGESSAENGLPHVSSEVAGKSARLIILMRHESNRAT